MPHGAPMDLLDGKYQGEKITQTPPLLCKNTTGGRCATAQCGCQVIFQVLSGAVELLCVGHEKQGEKVAVSLFGV